MPPFPYIAFCKLGKLARDALGYLAPSNLLQGFLKWVKKGDRGITSNLARAEQVNRFRGIV